MLKIGPIFRLSLLVLLPSCAGTMLAQEPKFPTLFTNAYCQGKVGNATGDPSSDAASGFAALWQDYRKALVAENGFKKMMNPDSESDQNHLKDLDNNTETFKRLLTYYLDANQQVGCVADLILRSDSRRDKFASKQIVSNLTSQFVSAVEKQAGSAVSSSGTTNVISKNLTSTLLSLSNEYGALTSSTSGQTTTVSGTLDQLVFPLEKHSDGLFSECAVALVAKAVCVNSNLLGVLGRVSYSAALDLNQPSTITGTATGQATGGAQQITGAQGGNSLGLSQFTAKYLVYAAQPSANDMLYEANSDKFTSAAFSKVQALRNLQVGIDQGSKDPKEWENWLEKTVHLILDSDESQIEGQESAFDSQIDDLVTMLENAKGNTGGRPAVISAALAVAAGEASDAASARSVYDKALWKKPLVSLEYDFNTPANQPTNSVFNLIYGQSFKQWKVTFNGGASIYNSPPSSSIPGAGRLRYAQVGAEGDYTIPAIGKLDTSALSLAYYFQDQTSPSILNVTPSSPLSGISFTGLSSTATQVFTQAGNIHLGQVKLTLGSSSSGFSFPVSVTVSNRTELVDNSTIQVRPQIGINYSFDSLLGK
ncbi:MAG: hypothetical protein ABSD59_10910 [Terracidiphilus sp.]